MSKKEVFILIKKNIGNEKILSDWILINCEILDYTETIYDLIILNEEKIIIFMVIYRIRVCLVKLINNLIDSW